MSGSRRGVGAGRDHEPVEREHGRRRRARPSRPPTSSATARGVRAASRGRGRRALLAQHDVARARHRRRAAPSTAAAGRRAGAARRRSTTIAPSNPRGAAPRPRAAPRATCRRRRRDRGPMHLGRHRADAYLGATRARRARTRRDRVARRADSSCHPRPSSGRAVVDAPSRCGIDVSGRPLRLRDVDLDAFLHPKTIAVIGASEQSAKPNTAMTREVQGLGRRRTARRSTRCTRRTRRCSARRATRRSSTCPATSTSRSSSPARPSTRFEEVLAAQGQVRGDLRRRLLRDRQRRAQQLEARLDELVRERRRAPARPEHEPQRVRGVPRRPRRARRSRSITQSRPPGPAGVPGPGDRHPAHALGADRQRGRPRVRRLRALLRRPARGRRDRLLHRGLQGRPHADARGRPRGPAAQADRDGEGRAHRRRARRWRRRTPATSPAPTRSRRAVFRQFGVTRVDGLDELLEVSAALARTRPDAAPAWAGASGSGRRASTRSRAAPARTWPTCSPPPGLRLPRRSPRRRSRRCTTGSSPRTCACRNPVDCGGPPVADAARPQDPRRDRSPTRTSTSSSCRSPARSTCSASRSRATSSTSPKTTDKPIFVVWGAPPGTDDTYYRACSTAASRCSARSATASTAVRAYVDYWTFAARYRSPFDDAPTTPLPAADEGARGSSTTAEPGEALSEHASKQLLAAYGITTSTDVLCDVGRRPRRRRPKAIGYPVVMKVSSPDLLHKSDPGSCGSASTSAEGGARRVRRAAARRPASAAGARPGSTACSCARW